MDIVYIRDLRIETIIGIFDWEREVKQMLQILKWLMIFKRLLKRMTSNMP